MEPTTTGDLADHPYPTEAGDVHPARLAIETDDDGRVWVVIVMPEAESRR